IADTGQTDARGAAGGAARAVVNALHLAAGKRHLSGDGPITSAYDFNRDGAGNAADFAAVSANRFQALQLVTLPPVPANAQRDRTSVASGVWAQLQAPGA